MGLNQRFLDKSEGVERHPEEEEKGKGGSNLNKGGRRALRKLCDFN